ncbi:hypothetical protein MLD38_004411 [Melastoma candidum]|uniref:Uncharacterized protein n=1 Tax=Melastoma candidum TaxID=119954 RepID=A0ACB9S8V3_9MYRT|nr:hypothetical protein MLD38_004411 [Melastoma candidum]
MVDVGVTEACEKVRAEEEKEGFLSSESESSGPVALASRENNDDDLGTKEDPEVIVEHDKNVISTVDSSLFSQPAQIPFGMDQRKDESFGNVPQHLEFYLGNDESELIPVELKEQYAVSEDDLQNSGGDVILELCMPVDKQCKAAPLNSLPTSFHETEADYSQEMKTSIVALHTEMAKDNVKEDHVLERTVIAEEETKAPVLIDDLRELGDAMAELENSQNNPAIAAEEKEMQEMASSGDEDSDVEVSIGTEIPDHETVDEVSAPEGLNSFEDNHRDASTVCDLLQSVVPCNIDGSGCVQSETETLEFKTIVVETCKLGISHFQQMCKDGELNHEMEEDKIADTPGLTDSFDVHSNLMLLDDRIVENEGLVEGSLVDDVESGEEDPSIDQLKEALKAERRSLHALYAELEEERHASAVATSQTMAMINRLQEEKASMQMEAVQYQRMMEEQSEYDQEALQLLNDLVMKTEKEKEELVTELEAYRQRVEEYEARDDTTTPSANTARQDSGYSEAENVDGDEKENTPCDAVTCLEDSLVDFEEERLRILEHIKSLEEKLVSVEKDDDGPQFEDVQTASSWLGNGNDDSNHLTNGEVGEEVSKHCRNGIIRAGKAKRLLPLIDATTDEDEDEEQEKKEKEEEGLAVEEELDYVYERLDALEADGEFLRHCMGSIRKGDKGLDTLREILQYLRDMRSSRE